MAKTLVRNVSNGPVTLPAPYNGILRQGAGVIVDDDVNDVIAILGGDDAVLGVLTVEATQDGNVPSVGMIGTDQLPDNVITGHQVAICENNSPHGATHLVYSYNIADAASDDYDIVLDHGIEVFDVTVQKRGGAGGALNTVQVKNGAAAITDVMSINVADQSQIYPITIDDATSAIPTAGTLRVSVVKAGGNAACAVFVSAVKR